MSVSPAYIWRKRVSAEWLERHQQELDALTGGTSAVIERSGRKQLLVEAATNGAGARRLHRAFGGRSEKLGRDWLNEMLRARRTRPIRIGQRLIVTSDEAAAPSANLLIIPAGAAFGTGEHATTAMSLRLLERITRKWPRGWRMLDAGTGSGILALSARSFGAGEVIAVENNPLALQTGRQNARLNRVRGVKFIEGDVAQHLGGKFNVITANLYSELLIALLPRFRRALENDGRLILSGVMRTQERALLRAMKTTGLEVREIRRRGKWLALIGSSTSGSTSTITKRKNPA